MPLMGLCALQISKRSQQNRMFHKQICSWDPFFVEHLRNTYLEMLIEMTESSSGLPGVCVCCSLPALFFVPGDAQFLTKGLKVVFLTSFIPACMSLFPFPSPSMSAHPLLYSCTPVCVRIPPELV